MPIGTGIGAHIAQIYTSSKMSTIYVSFQIMVLQFYSTHLSRTCYSYCLPNTTQTYAEK